MFTDGNALSFAFYILKFFLQFAHDIEISIKFIDFLTQLIQNPKTYQGEFKTLVDNSLLVLKQAENDDIIIKGDSNKMIRKIWQQKEEDVLFESRFVSGFRFFEDVCFYQTAKTFIMQNLHMDDARFYSKDLRHVEIEDEDPLLKVKLAFFYIRSIENIRMVQYYILGQVSRIDIDLLQKDSFLILFKTLFNLLKNHVANRESDLYQSSKEYLIRLLSLDV